MFPLLVFFTQVICSIQEKPGRESQHGLVAPHDAHPIDVSVAPLLEALEAKLDLRVDDPQENKALVRETTHIYIDDLVVGKCTIAKVPLACNMFPTAVRQMEKRSKVSAAHSSRRRMDKQIKRSRQGLLLLNMVFSLLISWLPLIRLLLVETKGGNLVPWNTKGRRREGSPRGVDEDCIEFAQRG